MRRLNYIKEAVLHFLPVRAGQTAVASLLSRQWSSNTKQFLVLEIYKINSKLHCGFTVIMQLGTIF